MLKQSPSRTQRSKGFKVKHVLQACLLIAVCIWLLNQLKHSYDKKAEYQHGTGQISGKVQSELEILKVGRKDLHPRIQNIVGQGDKEEAEEDMDENKSEEMEDEGRGGGDDEIDGHDQEKADEESEEVEDLIDVDDREREEVGEQQENEERSNLLEDASSEGNQDDNDGERYFQGAREEQSKGDDASKSMEQDIQTVTSNLETGSMRKMKEMKIENAKDELLETENNNHYSKEGTDYKTDSHQKVGNEMNVKRIHEPKSTTALDGNNTSGYGGH